MLKAILDVLKTLFFTSYFTVIIVVYSGHEEKIKCSPDQEMFQIDAKQLHVHFFGRLHTSRKRLNMYTERSNKDKSVTPTLFIVFFCVCVCIVIIRVWFICPGYSKTNSINISLQAKDLCS